MFYYRFRPPSELAYKELLYDELYFATATESNDPFDSHAFAEFSGDQGKWTRLLRLALGDVAKVFSEDVVDRVAQVLAERAPLSLSAVCASDVLQSAFAASLRERTTSHLAAIGSAALLKFIEIYRPPDRYFASFSESTDHCLFSKLIRALRAAQAWPRGLGSGCLAPRIPAVKSAHAGQSLDPG